MYLLKTSLFPKYWNSTEHAYIFLKLEFFVLIIPERAYICNKRLDLHLTVGQVDDTPLAICTALATTYCPHFKGKLVIVTLSAPSYKAIAGVYNTKPGNEDLSLPSTGESAQYTKQTGARPSQTQLIHKNLHSLHVASGTLLGIPFPPPCALK